MAVAVAAGQGRVAPAAGPGGSCQEVRRRRLFDFFQSYVCTCVPPLSAPPTTPATRQGISDGTADLQRTKARLEIVGLSELLCIQPFQGVCWPCRLALGQIVGRCNSDWQQGYQHM